VPRVPKVLETVIVTITDTDRRTREERVPAGAGSPGAFTS
jgi:hypothetical protein